MNNLSKGTGNYIDVNSPVYQLPYDPKGGSGILKAEIWVNNYGFDLLEHKFLPYQWSETVNGIELDIEKPVMTNAIGIEEDIYNSLKSENIKFDTLNFITK